MRLATVLFKLHSGAGRRAQGRIWIGKHRIAHNVYPWTLDKMRAKIQIEEQNLFYLRHPFLTLEQEQGASKELGKPEVWLNKMKVRNAVEKVKPSVTMEMRLKHLNDSEKWDV